MAKRLKINQNIISLHIKLFERLCLICVLIIERIMVCFPLCFDGRLNNYTQEIFWKLSCAIFYAFRGRNLYIYVYIKHYGNIVNTW